MWASPAYTWRTSFSRNGRITTNTRRVWFHEREFVDKIRLACRQRDQSDKDFVIIARSDSCRFEGLDEAIARVNAAADSGADMGMIFPRDPSELQQAPKLAKIPLVDVVSRGNRDNLRSPAQPSSAIWATRSLSTRFSTCSSAFTSPSAPWPSSSQSRSR